MSVKGSSQNRPDNRPQNRMDRCFQSLKENQKKALICFVTAGDPGLEETYRLVLSLEKVGVDIIELGVPFSDPIADGPVIQRSSDRALKRGTTLAEIIQLVKRLRQESEIPILLMGYYNPIVQYGLSAFARDLSNAGGDACLVVDLPPEESSELHGNLWQKNLHQIFLLTPTSQDKRLKQVSALASGFLYYVSLEGTTGAELDKEAVGMKSSKDSTIAEAKADMLEFIGKRVEWIKGKINLPVVVGFGVRTPNQVQALNRYADGVVIGSALIEHLEGKTFSQGLSQATDFIKGLAQGK